MRAALRRNTRQRHADYFTLPQRRAFLRTVAPLLMQPGHFLVGLLKVEGKIVAVQLWLSYRDVLYKWYSGYDPAWSSHGVMTLLTRRSLEWAMEHGATELDQLLGTGLDRIRWRGDRYRVTAAVLAPTSVRSRLGFIVHLGTNIYWSRLRRRLASMRWLRRILDTILR